MSTRKVLTLISAVGMLFSPVAFGGVFGEKLDSGLGDLPSSYAAAEYQNRVAGEKLDSGLGDLSADYTAMEFQRTYRVAGESLDSGLGDLSPSYTAAEFQGKQIVAIR